MTSLAGYSENRELGVGGKHSTGFPLGSLIELRELLTILVRRDTNVQKTFVFKKLYFLTPRIGRKHLSEFADTWRTYQKTSLSFSDVIQKLIFGRPICLTLAAVAFLILPIV